jgi:ABC-type uncharacterized transport system permease subunit
MSMFINTKNSVKASFQAGLKEALQFKGVIYSNIFVSIIRAFLMISIWGAIFGFQDIFPYLITLSFLLIPGIMPLFRVMNEHYETKIKEGWSLAFSKPLDPFLFSAFYSTGRVAFSILISIITGIAILFFLGYSINILLFAIAFIVVFLFDFSVAYFIAGFSYFFYRLWGLRVITATFYMLFSGLSFPLIKVSQSLIELLKFFPFTLRGHFLAISLLNNDIALFIHSVLFLFLYSLALMLIGYQIHKLGMKKFESQGG